MKTIFAPFIVATAIVVALGGVAVAQDSQCPQGGKVVDIRGTSDPNRRRADRELIKACLLIPNTTVRLGPDVDLDFSDLPKNWFPILFGSHSSLISVSALEPESGAATISAESSGPRLSATRPARPAGLPSAGATLGVAPASARTPHSRGPRLQYHYPTYHNPLPDWDKDITFMGIVCIPGAQDGEGSRISGFQLEGPDQGQQIRGGSGIKIDACLDVEISNMEISGWGAAAIEVGNSTLKNIEDPLRPNSYRLLIHDNFLHNNQHPEHDGHALGYGISAGEWSWSRIYQNVFDNNKHAITSGGEPGGYNAEHNLVLKGGGHEEAWYGKYVHIFDVHGNADCDQVFGVGPKKNCGAAGTYFLFSENAFQYKKEIDIKIRGKPRQAHPPTLITGNVFARSDEARAIDLNVPGNVSVVNNVYNVDTYGDYGVCDFDGDGVDDLFLATGVSWWFASAGQFQWTHLNNQKARHSDVRLGYFDTDGRCDVLHEGFIPGQWFISSGGTTNWKLLGNFQHPLKDIQFGRFGDGGRDHRSNVTRQTTHAFWRRTDGQWFVTPLSNPDGTPVSNPVWKAVASSSFPMNQLRFGDFNGDGVTDVLAVENGHWAISESATGMWRPLNLALHDAVDKLYIANMDPDDTIDDILRVESTSTLGDNKTTVKTAFTWWRSKNGVEPWKIWKTYSFSRAINDADAVIPGYAFAGRFGAAHEGATLVTDTARLGHFHTALERPVPASREWLSLFPY